MSDTNETPLTMQDLGRRGGQTTAARIGREGLAERGRKGGQVNAARHDREHFVRIGQMASAARQRKRLEERDARWRARGGEGRE